MSRDHIKRLAAPRTWQINRKAFKFVTKPVPGPHSLSTSIPLSILLKDMLSYANTTKEVKKIINMNEIKIDGVTRKDFRLTTGIFDTIEFVNINEFFRVILNRNGKIELIKINKDEALIKPCKIIGKTMVNGKLQLNLSDGNNVLVDSDSYKVGDTLILSLPDKKITKHLKLDKKSVIFLIGGEHTGEIGTIEDIVENKIIYKSQKGELVETSKKYAFVVGETKPIIRLAEHERYEEHQN